MDLVREIAQEIVAREGGYVDDPDDRGGATNHGVTIHTIRRLGLDLNDDGRIDRGDVRAVTPTQAVDLFVAEYFERPGILKLPPPLHETVFDMQVNAGSRAISLLQDLLTRMGFPVASDGIIGPQTIRAAHEAIELAPNHLVDAYGIERRNFYYRLARDRDANRKYVRRQSGGKGGWIIRAELFISEPYHLSSAEHEARVGAWD